MAATRETHTTRTHETTRRSYTSDEASAFLEASTLSNRAMTARRLFRFADALDDATRARSRCETYDAFSRERPSVRVELLSIKIACAQADALVNLPGRAWEACGVLRETLRRLARAAPNERRRTIERRRRRRHSLVGVFYISRARHARVCAPRSSGSRWAFCATTGLSRSSPESPIRQRSSPSPLSARQTGRLMRPQRSGERRATTAESSRRLQDALAGAEPRWRAFTAEAWIRACAASVAVSAPNHADAGATRTGTGTRTRFRSAPARSRGSRCTRARAGVPRQGRRRAVRARRADERGVRAEVRTPKRPQRSAHASGARTGRFRVGVPRCIRRFTRRGANARLAAEARALLAEAYEAVSDAAGKSEVSFASPDRGGATRHFLRAAENDADDVCATSSRRFRLHRARNAGRARRRARGPLPRRQGASDALVVDAGVAAAVGGAAPPSSTARTRPTPSACAPPARSTRAGSAALV